MALLEEIYESHGGEVGKKFQQVFPEGEVKERAYLTVEEKQGTKFTALRKIRCLRNSIANPRKEDKK